MSAADPLLDRAGIENALRRLGERLARRGVVADLYVFGGAAMALAYDARRSTRDIDAVFQPHGMKTVHLTPSDPNYLKNLIRQLRRVTCWKEA